jgi:hypothetical protein
LNDLLFRSQTPTSKAEQQGGEEGKTQYRGVERAIMLN